MPMLVKKRVYKNIEKDLIKKLEDFGISKNALTIYGLKRIKDVANKKNKKKFGQLEAAIEKYTFFDGAIQYDRLKEKFNKCREARFFT